uniref:Uncharacterized protein n=1 Tax=Oryza sativa subsp. japonica TaxID=39947 RepID=Q5VPM2_ORYSJ|nr:hypothetical protein [Oryza sativa Japonica Group]
MDHPLSTIHCETLEAMRDHREERDRWPYCTCLEKGPREVRASWMRSPVGSATACSRRGPPSLSASTEASTVVHALVPGEDRAMAMAAQRVEGTARRHDGRLEQRDSNIAARRGEGGGGRGMAERSRRRLCEVERGSNWGKENSGGSRGILDDVGCDDGDGDRVEGKPATGIGGGETTDATTAERRQSRAAAAAVASHERERLGLGRGGGA